MGVWRPRRESIVAHFGVLSYQGAGHLNPLIALARELVKRGHHVTFFLPPEFESRIRRQNLDFFPIDTSAISQTHTDFRTASQKKPNWIKDTRVRLRRLDQEIGVYLREYVDAIRAVGVDALLMGEITLTGPTVAEMLRLPYVVISTSIPHNFGWQAPRSLLNHPWQARLQAGLLEVSIFHMGGPVGRLLNKYRRSVGLKSISSIGRTFPELAHITQWPQCLDVSRPTLPARFFHTGPFVDTNGRTPIEFPWSQLTGKPLVYTSLGTTRKAEDDVYHRIATACTGLDLQLVITLGGRRNLESFADLPGKPLVVHNAPQLDLLSRADIVITHAGPNTVLETLLQGKPMLALPIALDQPAIAMHLQRLGVAEVLPAESRSAEEIRAALLRLRAQPRYRDAARNIQTQLKTLRGVTRAASIIEESLANCRRGTSTLAQDDCSLTSA
jgi:zeaxanthin glucosyltransferase